MSKRKPRNKMSKTVNLLYPITLEDFGSDKDPCFGKLNDPKANECQRCGDCEICAVVQSQNMHAKRAKVESTQKFKDIEKLPSKSGVNIKAIRSHIRKYLKSIGGYTTLDSLILDITEQFGVSAKKAKTIITNLKEKSAHIKFNKTKSKIKWDD